MILNNGFYSHQSIKYGESRNSSRYLLNTLLPSNLVNTGNLYCGHREREREREGERERATLNTCIQDSVVTVQHL